MRLGRGHDDGAFFFSRSDAAQQECCEPGFTLLCMGLFSRLFVQALPPALGQAQLWGAPAQWTMRTIAEAASSISPQHVHTREHARHSHQANGNSCERSDSSSITAGNSRDAG